MLKTMEYEIFFVIFVQTLQNNLIKKAARVF